MNEKLQRRIEKLEVFIASLQRSSSIPLAIDQSFRQRFPAGSTVSTSTKGATSENQAVDEGGAATYSVLKPPDAFLQVSVGGTTYNLPVYT